MFALMVENVLLRAEVQRLRSAPPIVIVEYAQAPDAPAFEMGESTSGRIH